jgi:hypothetical protein
VEPQQNHTLSALGTLVTSWRRHLQAANLSPKTVKSYLAAVDQFEAFLAGRGMPTDVTVLRREHVESFILHLTESRSASTDPLSRFAAVLQVGGRGGRDPDLRRERHPRSSRKGKTATSGRGLVTSTLPSDGCGWVTEAASVPLESLRCCGGVADRSASVRSTRTS